MNGVLEVLVSNSTWPAIVYPASANLWIGGYTNAQGLNNGYIDEIRLSNVARYTSASFVPPTDAFTVDNNTYFLHHMDGTNGSTSWSTSGQAYP